MGLKDMKTNLEKAAGSVDDKAKEMFDQAKDKVGDMADDADDKLHAKGGEVEGRAKQYFDDHGSSSLDNPDNDDTNYMNDPGYTGLDEEEFGAPGRKTPASDLDDNPLEDEDRSFEE